MRMNLTRAGLNLAGWEQPGWRRLAVLAACGGALLATLLTFNLLNNILPTADDVDLYYKYAFRTLHGELPYRDFIVEYPPFALLFLVLPGLLCWPFGGMQPVLYEWLFHTQCFLLNVGTLVLGYALLVKLYPAAAIRAHHRISWRMAAFTFGSVLISLYLMQRFDVGATFLTILAFWLLYNRRIGWSGFALGLGTTAKLYPAVLLPVVLLYLWYVWRDRRAAWDYTAGFTFACALVMLPFVLTGSDGLRAFLAYHSDRGIQVETIFATVIVLGSYLGLTRALVIVDHGALGLASNWVKPLASFSTILTVLGLLLIYYLLWRNLRSNNGRVRADWLIEVASLAVLWFILANKVLSPQYLVWVLAFVPLWRGWTKTVLFLLALPLSFLPFPFLVDWVLRMDALPFAVLALRNGLLVAILVLLAKDIWGSPVLFKRYLERGSEGVEAKAAA